MSLPVYLTQQDLLAVLDDMRERVAAGDSFEGSIEYTMPWSQEIGDPVTDPRGPGFRVRAAYRVGNSTGGQGSLIVIGEIE